MEKRKVKRRQNRINIPKDLLEFAGIQNVNKVAICSSEQGKFIRKVEDVQDCKVIAITNIEDNGRIWLKKDVFPNVDSFGVYVLNNELFIEELPADQN